MARLDHLGCSWNAPTEIVQFGCLSFLYQALLFEIRAREFQVVTLKFRMLEIESSRKDKRDQIFELTSEKKKITIKLDALRDFHAKRDIKVRQDLAKEQELRQVFKLKL